MTKLNKEKFMKTEMGIELEDTIRCWDKALDERKRQHRESRIQIRDLASNTGKTLAEVVRTDGKCLNWQSSSFMELNFSSQELMNILGYAMKVRASGS